MCNTAAIDEWNGASGMIFLVSIIISPLRSIKYIKQKCFQLQPQHCTIAAVCALLLLLVCCGPRKTAMRCQNNKKIKKQDNRIRLGFVICRDKSILPHAQIYELNCGHCNQTGSCFFPDVSNWNDGDRIFLVSFSSIFVYLILCCGIQLDTQHCSKVQWNLAKWSTDCREKKCCHITIQRYWNLSMRIQ